MFIELPLFSPRSLTLKLPAVAFTLLELLITVAVIGVLVSLLMPSLSNARRKADSGGCIGNLRQIGIAVRLYADENGGRLPHAQNSARLGSKLATELPLIQHVLAPHVSAVRNIFKCPADKAGVFVREGSSYEWNASLNGRILHRIGQDRPDEDSTKTFLLRDGEGWHPGRRKNAVFVDGHAGPQSL